MQWLPSGNTRIPIITEVAGKVRFSDMEDNLSIRRQTDELTGLSNIQVIDDEMSAQRQVKI